MKYVMILIAGLILGLLVFYWQWTLLALALILAALFAVVILSILNDFIDTSTGRAALLLLLITGLNSDDRPE